MQWNIVRLGHPALRLQAESVAPQSLDSEEMQTLIADLIETVHSRSGSGLAATQIGESHQILVLVSSGTGSGSEIVIINPLLEPEHADLVYDWESCLSVPGLKGLVPRYPKVRLRGLNAEGQPMDLTLVKPDTSTPFISSGRLSGASRASAFLTSSGRVCGSCLRGIFSSRVIVSPALRR